MKYFLKDLMEFIKKWFKIRDERLKARSCCIHEISLKTGARIHQIDCENSNSQDQI